MSKIKFNKIFQDKRWLNFSNMFTVLRFCLAPVLVFGVYCHWWVFAFTVFVVGGISDLLDGYLARLLDQQTYLGRLLDPIADKFFMIASFFSLSFVNTPSFKIPAWFVYLIVVREILILLGSFFLMIFNANFEVQPNFWGKITTFLQMIFIVWIFACHFFDWSPIKTYKIALMLLSIYTIISFLAYARIGFCFLFAGKKQSVA